MTEKQIQQDSQIATLKQDKNTLNIGKSQLEADLKEKSDKLSKAATNLLQTKLDLESAQTELISAKNTIKQLRTDTADLYLKITNLKKSNELLKEKRSELIDDECKKTFEKNRTLNKKLTEKESENKNLAKEKEDLTKKNNKLQKQVTQLQDKIKSLQN